MNRLKATVLIFLFFNLFYQIVDWPEAKSIFTDFIYENDYQKRKVLIDSIARDDVILTESAENIAVYIAYYSSPDDQVTVEDNTDYLWRPKNEKPNVSEFLDYHKNHNDSIYVWHHPKYRDKYAKDFDTEFKDSFVWSFIVLRIVFLIIALLTVVYLLFKKSFRIRACRLEGKN